MDNKDAAMVLDALLSAPGMNEIVKLDVKLSRKNVLILSSILNRGLSAKSDEQFNLLESVPKDSLKASIEELASFSGNCLQKAELTEFNEKLKSLNAK